MDQSKGGVAVGLLDSLKNKTSQAVSKTLSTTDRALKKAELNRQIGRHKQERDSLFTEFGKVAFQSGQVTEDQLSSFRQSVQSVESSIQELMARVKELDEQGEAAAPSTPRSFCPECGTEIEAGQKFCGGCGKSLTTP